MGIGTLRLMPRYASKLFNIRGPQRIRPLSVIIGGQVPLKQAVNPYTPPKPSLQAGITLGSQYRRKDVLGVTELVDSIVEALDDAEFICKRLFNALESVSPDIRLEFVVKIVRGVLDRLEEPRLTKFRKRVLPKIVTAVRVVDGLHDIDKVFVMLPEPVYPNTSACCYEISYPGDALETASVRYPVDPVGIQIACECCNYSFDPVTFASTDFGRDFLKESTGNILRLITKGALADALLVFRSLVSNGLTPMGTATQALLVALVKHDRVSCAISAFDVIYDIESRINPPQKLSRHLYFLFNSILSAFTHSSANCATIFAFFLRMLKETHQTPEMRGISKIFDYFSREHNVSAMLHFAKLLLDSNTQPYPLHFNLIIAQLVRLNDIFSASEIFRSMDSLGVSPNAVTYSTLIKGCLSLNMINHSESLLEEMIADPKLKTPSLMNSMGPFHSLLKYYVDAHMPEKAKLLFNLYLEDFSQLVSPTGYTFSLIIDALLQLNDAHGAFGCIKEMSRFQLVPTVTMFLPILRLCVFEGQFLLAKNILHYMTCVLLLEIKGPEFLGISRLLDNKLSP